MFQRGYKRRHHVRYHYSKQSSSLLFCHCHWLYLYAARFSSLKPISTVKKTPNLKEYQGKEKSDCYKVDWLLVWSVAGVIYFA